MAKTEFERTVALLESIGVVRRVHDYGDAQRPPVKSKCKLWDQWCAVRYMIVLATRTGICFDVEGRCVGVQYFHTGKGGKADNFEFIKPDRRRKPWSSRKTLFKKLAVAS